MIRIFFIFGMVNIFNLFLFLLSLWVAFMFLEHEVSWLYLIFGIICSILISIASFHFYLIEKNSELLYLSFGFYRYFSKIFLRNFFSSVKLIIHLAFAKKPPHPIIRNLPIQTEQKFHPALLMVSVNMTTGLLFLELKDDEILIHEIDENFFKSFELKKTCKELAQINDDNLV